MYGEPVKLKVCPSVVSMGPYVRRTKKIKGVSVCSIYGQVCQSVVSMGPYVRRTSIIKGVSVRNISAAIVLAAVHGLSGLFRAVSAVEPLLFRPLPPPCPRP